MRPLTAQQRKAQLVLASVIGAIAAVAVLLGIWVGATWPLGVYYGGLGILMGILAGAIALAIALAASKAPAA